MRLHCSKKVGPAGLGVGWMVKVCAVPKYLSSPSDRSRLVLWGGKRRYNNQASLVGQAKYQPAQRESQVESVSQSSKARRHLGT